MVSGLHKFDFDPADLDPNGILENQTTGGAATLVLDGALCDLGTPGQFDIGDAYGSGVGGVKLLFDSSGDINTVVFTITGQDQNGKDITETVTGVTTTPITTVNYYSQVTQIDTDSAVVLNVFIGTVTGELVGRTIPINRYSYNECSLAVTDLVGTCVFNLQQTFDNVLDKNASVTWINILAGQSADVVALGTIGVSAVRLSMDSYTDGAELQLHVSYQPFG